jgi:hypothetical protein
LIIALETHLGQVIKCGTRVRLSGGTYYSCIL